MTTNDETKFCDAKVVKHKYEMLRANALGKINQASGFTVFLRNGLVGWLRKIGDHRCARQKVHQKASSIPVDMPESGLASILTDIIMKTALMNRHSAFQR